MIIIECDIYIYNILHFMVYPLPPCLDPELWIQCHPATRLLGDVADQPLVVVVAALVAVAYLRRQPAKGGFA